MGIKVLIVEDLSYIHDRWKRMLIGKGVELLSALSIDEAEEKFTANPDIEAIVMDACVPGDSPTTIPLVREFRKTFTGPMIAASSDYDYRKMLMEAGCDHESEKISVPRKLCEVLGL